MEREWFLKLKTAIDELVKKDNGIVTPPIPEKPETPQKPVNSQKPNGVQNIKPQDYDEKEVVKTGDISEVIPMGVLSLTELGIIILAEKKRKFYN